MQPQITSLNTTHDHDNPETVTINPSKRQLLVAKISQKNSEYRQKHQLEINSSQKVTHKTSKIQTTELKVL